MSPMAVGFDYTHEDDSPPLMSLHIAYVRKSGVLGDVIVFGHANPSSIRFLTFPSACNVHNHNPGLILIGCFSRRRLMRAHEAMINL